MVFVVEQDQRGGDDVADAPGAAAPGAEPVVGAVERLLLVGEFAVFRFLERDDEGLGLAFVAQVGQPEPAVVDPGGDLGEQLGVARAAVVSCSRPGRTCEVHNGQPSGADTT